MPSERAAGWFARQNLTRKLLLAFVLVFLCILITSLFTLWTFRTGVESRRIEDAQLEVVQQAQEAGRAMRLQQVAIRDYLLGTGNRPLERLEQARLAREEALRRAAALAGDSDAGGRIARAHDAALAWDRGVVTVLQRHIGLPNRMLFMDRLGMAIKRAHRHGNRFALVYLDADRFKLINDTWGHAAGDAVLTAIAGRLTDRLRGNDTVARLGGDEFALIIEDVGGDRASVLDSLAELRGLLEAPLMHEVAGNDSVALPVRASMGLALYPEDGTDGTALMHAADHAMYANKRGRTDSVPSENENAA